MILAKAPMRVSFFGGGSDIPDHYREWGGSTISTAIDKYVYVTVNHTPHNHIKISYMKQELVTDVNDIKNDIVRNALLYFDIHSNIEITSFADIPTMGTGLGGSSSFTCALVAALAEYKELEYNPFQIAETACHIEIDMCGWHIGKQDQYAAAMGGMNYIKYGKEDQVWVTKMAPCAIHNSMLLIPTNIQRHAAEILDNINFNAKQFTIRELSLLADLYSSYTPEVFQYGQLLNSSWALKKQMSDGITTDVIDEMYEKCLQSGALGAKLLGAGGGGYMLALTNDKDKLRETFSDRVCLDVKIAQEGARVVYRD
jgi:D-glycero-alpha-D-manno-heptose-7-phosphate kinase